ncbi:metal ABC transporter ATP-binding protein [Metabacillus sp. RGM 3146]|uniref:metal ABC transporter ATP-binding protein n=1 Tax=Metabacillus sp. RGM 3146 TaxID=3401092 RepID=UPI003B9BA97F
MELLAANNVQFKYEKEVILDDISFSIHKGEFVTLTGPNGAAKSTLLRIMLGLLKPSKGSVKIHRRIDNGRKLVIGYVPQQIASFNSGFPSTVLELVQSGRFQRGHWFKALSKLDHMIVEQSLRAVDMWKYRYAKIGELSGGQKQRICISRVLASEPDLLVLDEPTTGMDAESRESFYQLMRHHADEHGRTILMVTHDSEGAGSAADRNILLERKENTEWKCFTLASCSTHFGLAD